MTSTDDTSERRSQLIAVALRALVGDANASTSPFPGGAAIHSAGCSHVWLDDRPTRLVSVAVLLAHRAGSTSLRMVVPAELVASAGDVARRAQHWNIGAEAVIVEGRSTRSVSPVAAGTEPLPPSGAESLSEVILDAGAEVMIEHGVVTGEVGGLEVCRVVADGGEVRLEVGVGVHDREAFQMLHGDTPAPESLARIVAAVAEIRTVGADPHPLNRLAPERALRRRLQASPDLVHSSSLAPVSPVTPAAGPGDAAPAHLVGEINGVRCLVACTSGTDLGSPADALDTFYWHREAHDLEEIVIAVPARNRMRAIEDLARLASVPTSVVSIPDPT